MNFDHFYHSFTDDELQHGAELFLADDLKVTIAVPKKTEFLTSALPLSEASIIKGTYKIHSGTQKEGQCSLLMHKMLPYPITTSCSCEEFQKDHYGCSHVAGLLCAYHVQLEGMEVFSGSHLEDLLSTLTGLDNPFTPGAMKRTDDRLLDLLNSNAPAALPVWKDVTAKEEGRLRCEINFIPTRNGALNFTMRAGFNRLYQISNLSEFFSELLSGGTFAFGKNILPLSLDFCDKDSEQLLRFLSGLHGAYSNGLYRGNLYLSSEKIPKTMHLQGAEIDHMIEFFAGSFVMINKDLTLPVDLSHNGLVATIKKKTYGASLSIKHFPVFAKSEKYLYLTGESCLFRIPLESYAHGEQLMALLEIPDNLYIRESDLHRVCRELLPVFQKYGTVISKGFDFESFALEKPSLELYLDHPDKDLLTCEAYAIYQNSGFKVPLYANDKDSTRRNAAEESVYAAELSSLFTDFDPKKNQLSVHQTEEELFDFINETLPRLQALGTVLISDTLKRMPVKKAPAVTAGIQVKSDHLILSLKSNDMNMSELGEILMAYRRKKKYYRLKNGSFLSFEKTENTAFETLAELYQHYGEKNPESISLPLYRALYLNEMLIKRSTEEVEVSSNYRKLLLKMDPQKTKKALIPQTLKSILRPYQVEGFQWIRSLKNCGFGGILADDMGLGKTLQVLTFLLSEKESGKTGDDLKTLIICPASLVYNWNQEILRYTPELKSVVVAGSASARQAILDQVSDYDILITSYDLLKRDIERYETITFANEIIDEAQFVKNQNTAAAKSVRVINSSFRMALTGTPIENRLSELWSILDYLMPGFLYGYSRFQKEFESPIVSNSDKEMMGRLRQMVHPFILRRLKKQVLTDLPEKMEEVITVRMDEEQQKLYDARVTLLKNELDKKTAAEVQSSKLEVLAELTHLRQICCDPSLMYDNYSGGSAKLEACIQLITQAIESGHKLLLFSQFTSMLDIICRRLDRESILWHRIDGSVSKETRMDLVDSFSSDDVPVFLISLKAGGTGLNLTAADIVIHYDPWWNQAAQNQATDRAHRIGQTERVTVYELICQNTIEEQIQKLKEAKSRLTEDVLSGESISSTIINRDDLLTLLD